MDRRAWLFPPAAGSYDGIDLASLEPSVEDERMLLIRSEHPEYKYELEDNFEPAADEPSPRLHLAVHEVVATQIWNHDPPETWATAQRLSALGYERHEVLHMVGSAVAEQLWLAMAHKVPFDHDRFVGALDALPGSWEAERDDDDDLDEDLDEDLDDDLDEVVAGHRVPRPRPGTTFTHRLTEAEVALQVLVWTSDQEPLGPLLEDHGHLHLTDEQVAESEFDDDLGRVLAGPPGWMAGFARGELVGLRVVGEDEVDVVAVTEDELSAPDNLAERLGTVFDEENQGDGMPVTVAELVNGVIGDPALGALVLPPAGEMLDGCGFEVRDGYAAPAGTDWDAFARLQVVAVLAAVHGLSVLETRALALVSELYRRFVEDMSAPLDADAVAKVLGDPDIGLAFVELVSTFSDDDDLAAFARQARPKVQRRDRAGLSWIEAGIAARQGDHERAEALLREAMEIDPEHRLAVEEAACYANDRGDGRRAVELLGRLDSVEADDRAAVLRSFAAPPPTPLARRNDPCPCGSGRKFKFCCLAAVRRLPLPERVGWIWAKLEWFVSQAGFDDHVDEVLLAMGSEAPEDELLATSLVLFRDGIVDDFLRQRGPVLPDDERNLVAQWALVEPSVHEVREVTPGVGLVLRDVRTGDVAEVRERLGSTQLAKGDLLYAHVVPDGHTHQMIGGVMPVPLRLRDSLMALLDGERGATELAELIRAAFSPPEMRNMEGEPVVLCEARYAVADPVAARSLDTVLEGDDDGRWSQWVEVDGRRWIRGTVQVEADELVVSANSEDRIARLRQVVEDAVPGLELVSATTRTPADVRKDRPPPDPAASQEDLPPGAADALTAFVREQEERWVDESVPALDGLTPRQAAVDPTRRQQLIALLHDFDRQSLPPGAATFDTGRLRARLGLDAT